LRSLSLKKRATHNEHLANKGLFWEFLWVKKNDVLFGKKIYIRVWTKDKSISLEALDD